MTLLLEPVKHQTKTQALCAQLTQIASQMEPDAKLPTVLALCKRLGVSVTTLNSALSVLESQGVLYRRHAVGIFTSPRQTQKSISLICNADFFRYAGHSPFWDLLLEQAQQRAEAKNERLSCHFAMSSLSEQDYVLLPDALMAELRSGLVQGALFIGPSKQAVEKIIAERVPVVTFAGDGPWAVRIDSLEVIRAGVARLAEQNCRRIALWTSESVTGGEFREAFRGGLETAGLPFAPERIRATGSVSESFLLPEVAAAEQGYYTALEVFSKPKSDWPDGVVITHDLLAQGALRGLQKLGIRPGQDVKIASHANRGSSVLLGYEEQLILLEVDPAEIVRAMFEMLETLMDGQTPPSPIALVKRRLK